MARDTHRVMPHKDGGWPSGRRRASPASHRTDTKAEAEKLARPITQHKQTELQIHGKDGAIQRSDSHGHDPRSSKG